MAMLINFIVHGYEWATTIMIMGAIPLFYYWRKDNWPFPVLVKRLAGLSSGYLAATACHLFDCGLQISSLTGSISDGIDHIIYSFAKRSYGGIENISENYLPHVNSKISEVLNIYLTANAYLVPASITKLMPSLPPAVLFYHIIILFAVFTIIIALKGKPFSFREGALKNLRAFAIVTCLSILAPLSWFIIFKGHSYDHGFLNPVTWFMPFCLFGFGLIGLTLSSLKISHKRTPHLEWR